MSLIDLSPSMLNLASLKPFSPERDAQEQAAKTQQQVAQVQLVNAQDEQQQNQAFRTAQAIAAKAPSVEAYTNLLAIAPRDKVEGLKASIAQMTDAQKRTLEAQILPAWIAGANNRPELVKEELTNLADGYDSKGQKDKAGEIRGFLAKSGNDLNMVTSELGSKLLYAMGPERFKALMDAQGMGTKRRKEIADALAAEGKADPELILAAKREQLAKAKNEEEQAKNAPEREAARARAQVLEADIKATEDRYKEEDLTSGIDSKKAKAFQDRASGRHLDQLTTEAQLTLGDRVATAAANSRIAQVNAAKGERENSPEAIASDKELRTQQIEKYKAEVKELMTRAGDLQPELQKAILADVNASREALADSVRIRRVEDEYRKIKASTSTGTPARLKAWARAQMGTEGKRDELYRKAESVIIQETVNAAQKIRPVSDTDMAILRGDKPNATSDPEYVANYMGALARAREAQAVVSHDMAAWQTEFRGPGSARRDTRINGVRVKTGEALPDFLQRAAEVREIKAVLRDPKTDPGRAARIREKLRADGEDI